MTHELPRGRPAKERRGLAVGVILTLGLRYFERDAVTLQFAVRSSNWELR